MWHSDIWEVNLGLYDLQKVRNNLPNKNKPKNMDANFVLFIWINAALTIGRHAVFGAIAAQTYKTQVKPIMAQGI